MKSNFLSKLGARNNSKISNQQNNNNSNLKPPFQTIRDRPTPTKSALFPTNKPRHNPQQSLI